jgi:hypothetical protein
VARSTSGSARRPCSDQRVAATQNRYSRWVGRGAVTVRRRAPAAPPLSAPGARWLGLSVHLGGFAWNRPGNRDCSQRGPDVAAPARWRQPTKNNEIFRADQLLILNSVHQGMHEAESLTCASGARRARSGFIRLRVLSPVLSCLPESPWVKSAGPRTSERSPGRTASSQRLVSCAGCGSSGLPEGAGEGPWYRLSGMVGGALPTGCRPSRTAGQWKSGSGPRQVRS